MDWEPTSATCTGVITGIEFEVVTNLVGASYNPQAQARPTPPLPPQVQIRGPGKRMSGASASACGGSLSACLRTPSPGLLRARQVHPVLLAVPQPGPLPRRGRVLPGPLSPPSPSIPPSSVRSLPFPSTLHRGRSHQRRSSERLQFRGRRAARQRKGGGTREEEPHHAAPAAALGAEPR